MSKKMMKRSLALGALMAFVITGSAMAAELTINYDNGSYNVVGTEISGELGDVYSSLKEANMAGEMNPYVTLKNADKTNVIPGTGLKGGAWTGTTVNAIGPFTTELNGNKVTLDGGTYNGPYRIYGASNYAEGQNESTSNANSNVVIIKNVNMDYAESQYPGVTGGWSWNDANSNEIIIEGSTLTKTLVYGGDAQFGDANNNTITIKDSTVGYVNGGTTRYDGYDAMGNGKGNANNNKVIVENSTINNSFKVGSAGGYGNANDNVVEGNKVIFNGDAFEGGFAECGNAENNKVTITDSTMNALVFGGRSQDKGNAIGNGVNIKGGSVNVSNAKGISGGITENEDTFGQGYEGDANQNTVTIEDATITAQVNGGYSWKGSANDNTVEITGGTVTGNVFGGYGGVYVKKNSNGTTAESAHGNASGNMVSVISVDVTGIVTGGCAHNSFGEAGEARNNRVYVEKSNITGQVIGGETSRDLGVYGRAINNEVTIIDSTVGNYVHGGSSSAEGDANLNKVTLTDVELNSWIAAGHSSWGNANDNTLVINGSETGINGLVFGGRAQANGSANNNSVTITDATINSSVYGGRTIDTINSGWEAYSNIELSQADENIVELENATVKGDIYGGSANRHLDGYKNTANGNKVSIVNGSVEGNVYGGYVVKGEANNNTVNISGNANLSNASLYGSNLTTSTGNTLNLGEDWSGNIKSVQNFNTVNFAKGSAVTVTNGMTLGSGATINLADGNDYTGTNYAINGNLVINSDKAILCIGSIKETTYNIAKEYSSGDIWTLVENDLMEVESWNTDGQLQVTVKAQSAENIANNLGVSQGTASLVEKIISNAEAAEEAVQFVENIMNSGADKEVVQGTLNAMEKMAEAGGQSATAARIVNNVTGVTNDRLSFNCGHSAPHKGGHGVGLFEEGSGADVWVEYIHGKDKVEDMPSSAGASSYEGQYNGIVMGVDFKKVNKFQSGFAFNYGEGDTNSVGGVARTHSDYDFWGIGYYGNIHNDDSNVIFDISYAKTDSDVTQTGIGGVLEAAPETTTWSAGVKVEKLYQNENVQIVPYTGLRYMSINTDDYATKGGGFMYNMDRQNIWLLPVGVSIKQEVVNDNGWTVSPRVDLSYIWAFGDTNSNMEVKSGNGISPIGYDVMDDGSFLGLVGIEAHKGQWGYGVSYSYQKGDHSESKKWYVDVNYSF